VVEASQMVNLLPPALPPVGIFERHRLSLTSPLRIFVATFVGAEAVARLAASATAAVASLLHRIHTLLVSYSINICQTLKKVLWQIFRYMQCSVPWIVPQVSEIGSAKVDIGGKLCPHGCLMLPVIV
jgi:hypothetical protein